MLTQKDYCDYETCVALKELGFDEYCRGYFDPLCRIFNETNYLKGWNNTEGSDCGVLSCPTLYEAQKWLREEKGYHIEIDRVGRSTGYDWQVSVVEMEHNLCKSVEHNNETYEEALLAGIKASVKILKEK